MTNDNQDDLWGGAPEEDLLGDTAEAGPDLFGDTPAPKAAPEIAAVASEQDVSEQQQDASASLDAALAPEPSVNVVGPEAKAQTDGYVVLARKYRPQTFDDIVGQEGVEQALRGAIATGQISHAYLFSGPRGTGKTSTARILAKAVNCQDGGPRPDPCGKCASCRSITAGSSLDVIEIDAASNTGVDNIRELKSGVVLAPFSRYKVYIVDEVHMLSNQAFNALLKTLEEPPGQVIFVLATTELHKVPETIISRCQTFMFRRFSLAELKGQLGNILDIETKARGITVSDENRERILDLISRNAEGGMRDAQVTLDQVLVLSKGELDFDSVRRFLGMADKEALDAFVNHLHERDSKALLELIEELVAQGQDLELFVKSACEHMRDILLVRCAGKDTSLINVSEDRALELDATAQRIAPAFFVNAIELFVKVVGEMKVSGQPRIVLELALLKLTLGTGAADLDDILRRLTELEKRVGNGGGNGGPGGGSPAGSSQAQGGSSVPPLNATPSGQSNDTRRQAGPTATTARDNVDTVSISYESPAEPGAASSPTPAPAMTQAPPEQATAAVGDAAKMMRALAARLQVESAGLFMALEKVHCGESFDGRMLSLYIAPAPKFSASQLLRSTTSELLAGIVKSLFGEGISCRVSVREDLPLSGGAGADSPVAAPVQQVDAGASAPQTDSSSDALSVTESPVVESPLVAIEEIETQLSADNDDERLTVYYPEEIREKAMRELKSSEFQELLSTDSKLKELVDKVKTVFGIDDKSLRFLRSTLTENY